MSSTRPSQNIAIRPMRPDDYPAVRALWEAAGLPAKPHGRDAE